MRALPYVGFASLAFVVQILAYFAVHSTSLHASMFRMGVLFDCLVTIPACYWLLLVRPGLRTKQSFAFIACVSTLRGAYMLSGTVGLILPVVAEAALVGLVISGRASLPVVRFVKAELAVFRFAFGCLKQRIPADAQAFTIHQNSGASVLFYLLAALTPVESFALHFVMPAKLAWIIAGLSVYSMVWMIALGRSLAALPILVDPEGITLHRGLLASIRIPKEAILSISRVAPRTAKIARFAVLADPTVFIEFRRPLEMDLALGLKTSATAAAIAPDDVTGFWASLKTNFDLPE